MQLADLPRCHFLPCDQHPSPGARSERPERRERLRFFMSASRAAMGDREKPGSAGGKVIGMTIDLKEHLRGYP